MIIKKRRRSSEEKKTRKRASKAERVVETSELTEKMASIVVATEPKDPMVLAMEGMEARLLASMKENREKELASMELRLKNNMKEVIESSIKKAIDTMGKTIHQMIASNPIMQANATEVAVLKEENTRLVRELQYLTAEQGKLESRMERIENRNLENCVIFHGIREDYKETDECSRDKVYRELCNLITEENPEDRYLMA